MFMYIFSDCMIHQWQNNTFSERLNAVLSQGGIFSLPHMSTSVKKNNVNPLPHRDAF